MGPVNGAFNIDSCRLQAMLPPMLTGMDVMPGVMGVPVALKLMLPVPFRSVPAGAVIFMPFIIALLNAL